MPVIKSSNSVQPNRSQSFLATLIAPDPSIKAPDERRKVELIAALSLAFALIVFVGIFMTIILSGWSPLAFAGLLFGVISLLAYRLSRGRQYTSAAGIFIGGFMLLAYVASFSGQYPVLFITLTFGILFVLSNLLALKQMVAVITVNALAVILATLLFIPDLKGVEALNTYAGVITLGVFVLLFAWYRNTLEELRLNEILEAQDLLRERNLDLQKSQQEVKNRFAELSLAAQVGQTISEVVDLDSLLNQATTLIAQEFDLYYVQIYLPDQNNARLILQSGTGEVGQALLERKHSLLIDAASINGRAALEKRAVIISDTSQSATFLKNPLLPETRGEMAIPLIVGNRVVGVLDIQSSQAEMLTEQALPAFEALAGQLAVAIENAKLLKEAEQARAEIEAQARRQIRVNWDEHLDAIHKAEQIGYSFDQNEVTPLNDVESISEAKNMVSAPISFVGEELGSLMVEIDDDGNADQTRALVNIVARQIAQQLENVRLLESAERYRQEAEGVVQRQTRAGWDAYIASREGKNLSYRYDSAKVIQVEGESEENNAFSLPLKIRDEEIGKLVLEDISLEDQEAKLLSESVAERLSAHIETLRLGEQSRSALAETQIALQEVEKLGTAIRQSIDGIALASMDGALEFVNDAWVKMHGYESDEIESLLGQSLALFHSEEQLINEVTPFNKSVEERGVNQAEVGHQRKDGSTFPTWMSVSVLLSKEKEPIALVASAQDITERKAIERRLQQSAEERAEALRIAQLANWEYDVDRDIFTFNDQFYNILHTNAEEMGGYEIPSAVYAQKFVHPEDAHMVGSAIQKSLESSEKHYQAQLEHRVIYADGGQGYFQVNVTVEKDENRKVLQYIGANQDITERKRVEATIQKRAAELATVAAISTQVASLRETEVILQSVVDLSKENFGLYHAHIYMLDEIKENLVLAAGAGEAGAKMVAEGWRIPLSRERSLVARTAREKQGFIINNVREEEGFMANPLLPDTAAELAVPLVIEGNVLGVLDVQSTDVDYFTAEDLNIQTTLAAQIAVAIQNARSFKVTQEQAKYEAKVNLISQRIQGTTNVEEALQVAVRELGRALGAKQASIQLDVSE